MIDFHVSHLLARAQRCRARSDRNGAIAALRELLSASPTSAHGHAMLAECLLDARRLFAAEHEAKLALELDPQSESALFALARVSIAKQSFAEAERLLDEAAALAPESPNVPRLRAAARSIRGQHDQAIALLEIALTLAPDDLATQVALGMEHLRCGQIDDADAIAEQVLREEPERSSALLLRGWVLLRRGAVDDAKEHAIWALRQQAGSEDALRLMVAIQARKSVWLGLWWRWNVSMNDKTNTRQVMILVGAYAVYRVVLIAASEGHHARLLSLVEVVWMGIVAYTWIAPAVFLGMMKRELRAVVLSREF